ncbi:hypothetical protein ABZU45_37045 [Streptomyces avermitilis]|uniref:hypothetical protein n=1 Tax=Streptomyces avermitilis TaxID=33903 RepID=UPI0033AA9234
MSVPQLGDGGFDPLEHVVKAVTEDLFTEQEPVGKRITARLALSDDPGGHVTGRRPP